MITLDHQTIRKVLGDLDGWSIYNPEEMISQGVPAEIVLPHVEVHKSNPSRYTQSIFDDSGKLLDQVRGIHGLDLLYAIAENLGADTREANGRSGRGSRGEALKVAILAAMG
jgi:hypothetical protein